MNTNEELLKPAEVAAALKMNERTVKRWLASGKLPGFRLDEGAQKGDWRVRKSELDEWIAQRSAEASEARVPHRTATAGN